jgi:signal transduction histidine kinase
LTPQVREVIGSSLEEIDRLTKITEGLLVVSRLEAGEAHMEWERFDLAELVRSTTEQISLLAEDKGVALSCDMPEALETHGSPMRLKQVVVNLLDNAIKYTPAGGKVRVALRAWNGRAVLEVADSGPGIPAESIGHIFERFYRADQARARKNGGVGLGLSIAKSICAAHGGEIQVASAEGLGSRFRVELPVTAPRDLSARSPLKAGDGVADVAGKIA